MNDRCSVSSLRRNPLMGIRTAACLLVSGLFLTSGGNAHADPARDALVGIAKCADIKDAAARLQCFDTALPSVRDALAATPAAPSATRSLLDWFGFNKPAEPPRKPEDFGKQATPAPGDEISQITSTVVEFARNARGRVLFILDNGQVWRQADGDTAVIPDPPAGSTMKVTIETGAFTSYNLTIEGNNRLIKVVRVK